MLLELFVGPWSPGGVGRSRRVDSHFCLGSSWVSEHLGLMWPEKAELDSLAVDIGCSGMDTGRLGRRRCGPLLPQTATPTSCHSKADSGSCQPHPLTPVPLYHYLDGLGMLISKLPPAPVAKNKTWHTGGPPKMYTHFETS